MPANNPAGYPYPLPTEPVAEGAAAIRALADAIAAKGLTLIETKTLTVAGPFVFSAIPQVWTHLLIRAAMRTIGDNGGVHMTPVMLKLNNVTTGNYNYQTRQTRATVTTAAQAMSDTWGGCGWAPDSTQTNSWSATEIIFPGYRQTGAKSWQGSSYNSLAAAGGTIDDFGGQCWGTTAALTRIDLYSLIAGNNFVAGSIASLYGLP